MDYSEKGQPTARSLRSTRRQSSARCLALRGNEGPQVVPFKQPPHRRKRQGNVFRPKPREEDPANSFLVALCSLFRRLTAGTNCKRIDLFCLSHGIGCHLLQLQQEMKTYSPCWMLINLYEWKPLTYPAMYMCPQGSGRLERI